MKFTRTTTHTATAPPTAQATELTPPPAPWLPCALPPGTPAPGLPTGHDDPESRFYIHPNLRAFYLTAEVTVELVKDARAALDRDLRDAEHARRAATRANDPAGSVRPVIGDLGQLPKHRQMRQFEEESHEVAAMFNPLPLEYEPLVWHRVRLTSATRAHAHLIASREATEQGRKLATCAVCAQLRPGKVSVRAALAGTRVCDDCTDAIAHERLRRNLAQNVAGKTRAELAGEWLDRRPDLPGSL